MSRPIIFDSGALIALFNKNESEIAKEIEEHIRRRPHSPRIVYEPNMVEIFYRLIKKDKLMAPRDVQTNFDHFGIEIFHPPTAVSEDIMKAYMSISYKAGFDYADFYMCSAAVTRFSDSEILTVDREDLPLALTRALEFFAATGASHVQLFPFGKK